MDQGLAALAGKVSSQRRPLLMVPPKGNCALTEVVFTLVWLSVCLSICEQDISKCYGRIQTKLRGHGGCEKDEWIRFW